MKFEGSNDNLNCWELSSASNDNGFGFLCLHDLGAHAVANAEYWFRHNFNMRTSIWLAEIEYREPEDLVLHAAENAIRDGRTPGVEELIVDAEEIEAEPEKFVIKAI